MVSRLAEAADLLLVDFQGVAVCHLELALSSVCESHMSKEYHESTYRVWGICVVHTLAVEEESHALC